LTPGVEGTTCVLSFIVLPVIDLVNIGNDDQFEESGEGVYTEISTKGLHDPILTPQEKMSVKAGESSLKRHPKSRAKSGHKEI
jgi:hypothetical protein